MVQNEIDPRFYYNKDSKMVMFTNATTIFETKIDSNTIGEETVDFTTCILDGDVCYVNIEFLKKYVDFKYKYVKEKDGMPARIVLTYQREAATVMTVDSDIEMRTGGNYQNLIVAEIPEDSKVTVIEESKNWDCVRTEDGLIGYVPTSELENKKTEKRSFKTDRDEYTHIQQEGQVSMAWHLLTNVDANAGLTEKLKNTKGLNVISPTWFIVKDGKGNLSSIASSDYVAEAHSKGLKVWALVSDLQKNGRKAVSKSLKSNLSRRRMVNDLMFYAEQYHFDGINVDFEYITEESAADYLQFLRELSIKCRAQGLVLSVDNYVPEAGATYYDMKQQGLLADYVAIMSYDEHATDADGAGSVSSLGFTENAIKETIELVGDASRVINGMPFYTTAWIETPANDSDGSGTYVTDSVNGDYYLTCQDISMDTANELYQAAGATPVFDDNTGQNQVSYEKGKSFVIIWLEDETSVKSRLDLMKNYKLGGAAYWSLGQESANIWNVVGEYFK
jgi:spore germination protein YaaH